MFDRRPTPVRSDGPIELTVATFNDFGYTDELLQEYMDENPNVTIVHNKAATSNDARANYFQKLGKERPRRHRGHRGRLAARGHAVLRPARARCRPAPQDRWLDWKADAATDADGRLIGYGTDIGPEGVCYRSDLFEAAGLPSDREEVAALFEGDWDNYFEVGAQYNAATGKALFDSAGGTYQGMINQVEAAYEDPDPVTSPRPTTPTSRTSTTRCSTPARRSRRTSASGATTGSPALANGEFATMLCPLDARSSSRATPTDVTGWDVANVFPNGGGNWGGSYLTVPANGEHVEEAQKLADWLTAPEQQIKAFVNAGTFPSQIEAYDRRRRSPLVERVLQRRADRPDLHRPRQGRHGRTVQGRGLLQINDAHAECPHPCRRRHAKTSRRRGTSGSPRSKRSIG